LAAPLGVTTVLTRFSMGDGISIPKFLSMLLSSRIISVVIASKAKRSRLEDCGCGLVWIA
jgi:hypothetical protein